MLTSRQTEFCRQYVVDFNGTQAAIRAGYAEIGAGVTSCNLLKDPKITERIEDLKEERAAKEELSADWVLRRWKEIAEADVNDLVQMRKTPCKFCWAVEYSIDYKALGFDFRKHPCPECAGCEGEGVERPFLADTRKLKGGAKRLYRGIKVTANGYEIKLADQSEAMLRIANYLGMDKRKVELTGADGGPLAIENVTAADLTDDALAAVIHCG